MGPLPQPVHNGFTLPVRKTGQGIGHSPERVFLLIIFEILRGGTNVFAIETDIKSLVQQVFPGQRIIFFKLQHKIQDRVFKIRHPDLVAFIQHRMKSHFTPALNRIGVNVQPGGRIRGQPGRIVNQGLGAPAFNPLETSRFQLTGCIITTVANTAALLQYGLYIVVKRDVSGSRGIHEPIHAPLRGAVLSIELHGFKRTAPSQNHCHQDKHGKFFLH